MMTYLEMLRRQVSNEKGAEVVEWVIWVGLIAAIAGTLFAVLNPALSTAIGNIVTSIGGS